MATSWSTRSAPTSRRRWPPTRRGSAEAAAKAKAEQERELAAAQRLADVQRQRTRVASALGLFALLLAGLAGWQWCEAGRQAQLAHRRETAIARQIQQERAEFNLSAAARAADGLVFDLAQQLRAVTGVSAETIRLILSRADTLLADLAPGDDAPAELRRTRYAALVEFATTYLAQGDLEAAQAAAEQSREIIAKLATADPGNAQWQRDLSVSWNKLGDVRVAQGDLPGALQAFTEGKNIADQLAAADPGNATVAARPLRQLEQARRRARWPRATCQAPSRPSPPARTSPTSSPPPTPATHSGSAT